MRVLIVLMLAAALGSAQNKPPRPKATFLTGCVDELEGGRYVLLGTDELHQRAELRADGFPNDTFAQYLGHTVRVSGSVASEKPLVLRVRKIERLSETCAPPAEAPK